MFIVLGPIELNKIKYPKTDLSCVPGVDGEIHPHQEHMKDTYKTDRDRDKQLDTLRETKIETDSDRDTEVQKQTVT